MVVWLQSLLGELGFPQPHRRPGRGGATAEPDSIKNRGCVIYEDNRGAQMISQNNVFHQRTKHVATKWAFILDYVNQGHVCVTSCGTNDQIADLLTKGVSRGIMDRLRPLLMGVWCTAPGVIIPGGK